jgi:hypothetical protein
VRTTTKAKEALSTNVACLEQSSDSGKDLFQKCLNELCKGIGGPSQKIGRPRLSLEDMIFSAVFKVYSTLSARRFMSDLRDAQAQRLHFKTSLL